MKYYQVLISAENKTQAGVILDSLLKDKLILGGPIIEGPAKFWWKGEIVEMNYAYIMTYTIETLIQKVVENCKSVSIEEVPMISFVEMAGNQELIDLINVTLNK